MSKINKIFSWLWEKRKNQKNITVIIYSQLYILLLAFCTTFFIFKLLTNLETSTLGLLFGDMRDEFIPRFLFSYFIIWSVCELLYLTTFFLYAPLFTVYPIITFAGIANVAKIIFRSEPFVFTDLLLFKESVNIASQYPLGLEKYLPFLLPVFVMLLILPLFSRRIKVKVIKRVSFGAAAIVFTAAFFAHTLIAEKTFIDKKAHHEVFNLANEYKRNGFILEFMLSAKRSMMFSPGDYNKSNAREYALKLGYPENYTPNAPPESLPNVIIIMNEAYWDTDNLDGIAFNRDPLESVRGIMEQNGNLSILSPLIGGGTSNAEFELLTGKNIIYYPPAANIYQQFVTKKHWSLAWYFRDYGYSTMAIHPYFDWFWKRNTVYPLLGFENMYFDDGNLNYTDKKGEFISDRAVSDEIISRYKMFSDGGNTPVFTFAVTMQNHGPYYVRYWGDNAKIALINQIDEHPKHMVETYAEGVRYASEAFIYLTEYFENIERPTFIIMFGDHAPSGVADMMEFYALTENGQLTEENLYHRYLTPLIIWTNQKDPETEAAIRDIGVLTPQMLAVEIFNITKMPKPAYIVMLENIKKTTRGFTNQYYLDENGTYNITNNFAYSEKIKDVYEKLRIVQYDATLGKNYFINEFIGG